MAAPTVTRPQRDAPPAREAESEPSVAPPALEAAPGDASIPLARLEDQLEWYSRRSRDNRKWFQRFKVVEIVVAAAIPVVAALGGSSGIAAVLGGTIVVLVGLQQTFRFQQNWESYRRSAEALKREKFLFKFGAGDYAQAPRPALLLAERVEALVSSEVSSWIPSQSQTAPTTGRSG